MTRSEAISQSETMSKTFRDQPTTPDDSARSVGGGINAVAMAVPIGLAGLAALVAVVIWRHRGHQKVSDSEYRSVTESFFEVRID
jgi:hypothetical protein